MCSHERVRVFLLCYLGADHATNTRVCKYDLLGWTQQWLMEGSKLLPYQNHCKHKNNPATCWASTWPKKKRLGRGTLSSDSCDYRVPLETCPWKWADTWKLLNPRRNLRKVGIVILQPGRPFSCLERNCLNGWKERLSVTHTQKTNNWKPMSAFHVGAIRGLLWGIPQDMQHKRIPSHRFLCLANYSYIVFQQEDTLYLDRFRFQSINLSDEHWDWLAERNCASQSQSCSKNQTSNQFLRLQATVVLHGRNNRGFGVSLFFQLK